MFSQDRCVETKVTCAFRGLGNSPRHDLLLNACQHRARWRREQKPRSLAPFILSRTPRGQRQSRQIAPALQHQTCLSSGMQKPIHCVGGTSLLPGGCCISGCKARRGIRLTVTSWYPVPTSHALSLCGSSSTPLKVLFPSMTLNFVSVNKPSWITLI